MPVITKQEFKEKLDVILTPEVMADPSSAKGTGVESLVRHAFDLTKNIADPKAKAYELENLKSNLLAGFDEKETDLAIDEQQVSGAAVHAGLGFFSGGGITALLEGAYSLIGSIASKFKPVQKFFKQAMNWTFSKFQEKSLNWQEAGELADQQMLLGNIQSAGQVSKQAVDGVANANINVLKEKLQSSAATPPAPAAEAEAGVAEGQEAAPAPQPAQPAEEEAMQVAQPVEPAAEGKPKTLADILAAVDKDGNHTLSKDELAAFDKNKDKNVSLDEILGDQKGNQSLRSELETLIADKPGSISCDGKVSHICLGEYQSTLSIPTKPATQQAAQP